MVRQGLLRANDWAWKVLVYGSYLDYNFILRLKKEFPFTVGNMIRDKKRFILKQGLKEKDGKKRINVAGLIGKDYIKTSNVRRGYILNDGEKWNKAFVGVARFLAMVSLFYSWILGNAPNAPFL